MKGWKIFRIFGIDVEIHWSWLIICFLFTWIFTDYFSRVVPGKSGVVYWLCGAVTFLMFFASVLIHEIAHSLVGRQFGMYFKKITLFIIGGAAQFEGRIKSAKAEFFMALAGPLSSVAVAIFLILTNLLVNLLTKTDIKLVTASLSYLVFINLILAIFNLLPAYPMDGGRIFKAILWAISKKEMWSLKIATRVGQSFGLLMMIAGFFKLGFWFVIIGWFLFIMAPREYHYLRMMRLLTAGKVKEAMDHFDFQVAITDARIDLKNSCAPEDNLADVVEKMLRNRIPRLYVVDNGKVVGEIFKRSIEEYRRSKKSKL